MSQARPTPPVSKPPSRKIKPRKRAEKRSGDRRLRLRHMLFALLLLPGILPLLVSSTILINRNQATLKTQEQVLLTHSAQQFVGRLSDSLGLRRSQMQQLGRSVISAPGFTTIENRLGEEWVQQMFREFIADQGSQLLMLRAVSLEDQRGLIMGGQNSPPQVEEAMVEVMDTAVRLAEAAYRFVPLSTAQ
ncbi:MAG: hypothetical protein AAFX50_16910, partial [Acidobacteriota bacterium]